MGLDTKYRPIRFDDVVGQEPTVRILRHYISTGSGFHQSYLFAGHHGSGKTTLARILARALLCQKPLETGDPCDTCFSCVSLLTKGAVEGFTEFDAASNSGKDDIKRILEEIEYSTYSGNRRIYLIDECFSGDTLLTTPSGEMSISDIVKNRYDGLVLSYDTETHTPVWNHVSNWFSRGVRKTIKLQFDNGVSVSVTPDHKFFTQNRGWVAARDLHSDDEVEDFGDAAITSSE